MQLWSGLFRKHLKNLTDPKLLNVHINPFLTMAEGLQTNPIMRDTASSRLKLSLKDRSGGGNIQCVNYTNDQIR